MTAKDITIDRKWTGCARLNEGLGTKHLDPEEVRCDALLSRHEKRAILADWASDARSVEHMPGYRQLDDGALVWLDDILAALRRLDADTQRDRSAFGKTRQSRRVRRRVVDLLRWSRKNRDDDDGDDPPPTPAFARPRSDGGRDLPSVAAVPLPVSMRAA